MKSTIVIPFRQADSIDGPLTEHAREGARPMLAEALKAEADSFVVQFAGRDLLDGRHQVVRHGHAAVWTIRLRSGRSHCGARTWATAPLCQEPLKISYKASSLAQ